jgi:L-aspartate oxidase
LLEGLVTGATAGVTAGKKLLGKSFRYPIIRPTGLARPAAHRWIYIDDMGNSLKSLMWREVSVERDGRILAKALQRIDYWSGYVMDVEFTVHEGWELQNMLTVARLITFAALRRTESRGVHYRLDYPESDDQHWRKYINLHI